MFFVQPCHALTNVQSTGAGIKCLYCCSIFLEIMVFSPDHPGSVLNGVFYPGVDGERAQGLPEVAVALPQRARPANDTLTPLEVQVLAPALCVARPERQGAGHVTIRIPT